MTAPLLIRALSASSLATFLLVTLDTSRRFQLFYSTELPGEIHGAWWLYRWLIEWPWQTWFFQEVPRARVLSIILALTAVVYTAIALIGIIHPTLRTLWLFTSSAVLLLACAWLFAWHTITFWNEFLGFGVGRETIIMRGSTLLALSAALLLLAAFFSFRHHKIPSPIATRLRTPSLALLTLLAFSALPLPACEKLPGELDVPSRFTILVADLGRPVSALPIRITPKSKFRPASPLDGATDPAGKFLVEHLEPGDYELSVGHATAFETRAVLKVAATPATHLRETIKFSWLGNNILTSRHLHGILKSDAPPAATPKTSPILARTKISVLDARSLAPVAEVTTDAAGRFDLKSLPPGAYRLQISPPAATAASTAADSTADSANYLPLVITAATTSSSDPVELSVVFTSCGLYFSARPLAS